MNYANKIFRIVVIALLAACNNSSTVNKETIMNNQDKIDILKENNAFAEAWDKGDAKTAASFFTEDGMRVGAFGDVQHGRAEIEAAYDKLLHQTMAGAKVKIEEQSVKMLSPDIALTQGRIEIITSDSTSMKGYVVQVMKKINGRWLVFEAHPKLFPPPREKK